MAGKSSCIYCCTAKLKQPSGEGALLSTERVDELAKRALKKGNIYMQINISKAEVKCEIWGKKTKTNVARKMESKVTVY